MTPPAASVKEIMDHHDLEHDSEAGSWRFARFEPEGPRLPHRRVYAYDECGTAFRHRRELRTAPLSWSSISAGTFVSSTR
jgi:hypothetical protein